MGRRYVRSVVDLEQDFFLVIDRRRRENLIAGQMAVICPHRRADRLQRCHCMLKLIDEMAKAIHDKKTGREGD